MVPMHVPLIEVVGDQVQAIGERVIAGRIGLPNNVTIKSLFVLR